MKILVIEDCIDTFKLVECSLAPMNLIHAQSLLQASEFLEEQTPNLILIDVELPDGNGVDYCTQLGGDSKLSKVPKIILTSRSEISDKVLGLYSGAEDYITKPFSPQELKARCQLRLRPSQPDHGREIGPFYFNLEYHKCQARTPEGKSVELDLTPTEFKILYTLASHQGSAFTRNDLVRKIWLECGSNIEKRGVDTHISHLRRKMGRFSGVIVSIYGKGYSFDLSALTKLSRLPNGDMDII